MNLNKLKNKKYLVLLSDTDKDIKDSVYSTFENVIYFEVNKTTKEEAIEIANFINENNCDLILFDDHFLFRKIVVSLKKSINVYWATKHDISSLTAKDVIESFSCIQEYYDRRLVDKILFLDEDAYEVYKNAGYNCEHIYLDVKTKKDSNEKNDSIGIISDDWNPNHNVYNQLSAITMVDYSYVKLNMFMEATRHFVNFFNVRHRDVKDIEEIISNNKINLYINFTSTRMEYVLKSLDKGIPILLGNTNIFDKYKTLKKYLVLKQDDDIGEIAKKIDLAIEHKKEILEEYKEFRKEYTKRVELSLKNII